MVKGPLSVGVIGIQGAVSEHVAMMKQVFSGSSIDGVVRVIKPSDSLSDCDGVILPGGESTTISRVLHSSGLSEELIQRANDESLVIMGTCAGCILLAWSLIDNSNDVTLLKLMDMEIERNAYGRQRESFEQNITIDCLELKEKGNTVFPAIFIRAPVIKRVWGEDMEVLAVDAENQPIMIQQNNCLALTFHPELSKDPRIHHYFLRLVKSYKK